MWSAFVTTPDNLQAILGSFDRLVMFLDQSSNPFSRILGLPIWSKINETLGQDLTSSIVPGSWELERQTSKEKLYFGSKFIPEIKLLLI